MDMDAVWIPGPEDPYLESTIITLQNYSRNGGKIVIAEIEEYVDDVHVLNEVFEYPGWQPTMLMSDSTVSIGSHRFHYFYQFSPFTNGVDTITVEVAPKIICGEHAFPFLFTDSTYSDALAAISYPFAHELNCSSFIVIMTGTCTWEAACTIPYYFPHDTWHMAVNMLCTAAGVPGYELEIGAIPGGGNACEEEPEEYHCSRTPNPFTPNDDGFNDYCQFEFDNIGQSVGTIYIYNLHGHEVKQINVPEGANAKTEARWYGWDNKGNSLPQGVYLYIIESRGEIVCEGTVVIAR